ncbi:gamma-glutamyl-gamma-aminobutyrate hydrolase family protein [Oharaeibacter diazotrophicus]|uniref:gamma-glutamyl-gamma-aminobutyrate hydrolase n=1 Tax=Oharaeibacter diazotrophicus TaxID=1920512 RepID=A0A4R6RGY3_9HYPH|nr:gamma-glutamyl-gamma-aminobutyrate hydrolase family protein [Oharaeibacter diazotrophicus]TDP84906.1 putative glutamine amidotransferase [Oharaeibacter diazotrophicus]BBE73877.1 gamma-glutamyl-gamma-aminobutyrate hydrolase PuuD [Pleomorphomonas sp. SM30]GLS76438.1 gamma-glutamyl-gamma-aminobutyrate hydrolase [Oharaeibacter diazotrophicus]
MAPVVLVSPDVRNFQGYDWHAAPATYLEATLSRAGAMPLILPAFGERIDLDAVLDRVDGVLCTGSRSNVHPARYGVVPTAAMEPFDEARDATTLPLIRAAIRRGIPLLCICRGLQELNVALGGSLLSEVQEEEGRMDHRAPDSDLQEARFAIRHPVRVAAGGCLGRILGAEAVDVNSLHRQAIGHLAEGLVVEALAEDGVIEAVSVRDAPGFVLGVQWHPEYWAATDGPSGAIFEAFGAAARARAAARG